MLKKTPYFLLILLLIIWLMIVMFSCQKSVEEQAGVKHFYFEFTDQIETAYSQELITQISDHLPRYDYLISEKSAAKGWPFYGQVKRGKQVLKSEMIPPHTNVNRLSSIDLLPAEIDHDAHVLRLHVMLKEMNQGELVISKQSFKWNGVQWQDFSMEIESRFPTKAKSSAEVADQIAKTLIRYTFK